LLPGASGAVRISNRHCSVFLQTETQGEGSYVR
jgi:hypothetical protein